MRLNGKRLFIVLVLIGLLFIFGRISGEAGDTVTKEALLLSVPAPVQNVILVVFVRLVNGDETMGALAVYDDPGTERRGDYLELYNSFGDVLALGWFDRFGIARTAIDRGLLEASQKLEGVFIVLADGISV